MPPAVTVKVNVIYDRNASLTGKEKEKFNKTILQGAKDEYGNAHIHLDVTYTAGGFDDKGNLQGAEKDAINVVARNSGDEAYSGITQNGYALTYLNVDRAGSRTFGDELNHYFQGDVFSPLGSLGDIGTAIPNAYSDFEGDAARAAMRTLGPALGRYSDMAVTAFPPFSGHIPYNQGAKMFQGILSQDSIRPQQ